jgi:hypothetical protein
MIISKTISFNNYNIKSIIIKNIDINYFEYLILNIGFKDFLIIYKEELIIKNKFNPLNILKIDLSDYFDLSEYNDYFPSNKLIYNKIIIYIKINNINIKNYVEIDTDKYLEIKPINDLFSLINLSLTFYDRIEFKLNTKSSKITIPLKNVNDLYFIIDKKNILNKLLIKPFYLFEINEIKINNIDDIDNYYKYYQIKIDINSDEKLDLNFTGLFNVGKIIILFKKNLNLEICNGMTKIIQQNLGNFSVLNITKKKIFIEKSIKNKEKDNNDFLNSKYI